MVLYSIYYLHNYNTFSWDANANGSGAVEVAHLTWGALDSGAEDAGRFQRPNDLFDNHWALNIFPL